ncbi:MAG: hypothetical protein JWM74_2965 [Myxococcaceae bacterium]|nr:hypothetical protein [Myxococcaceae bacterium]
MSRILPVSSVASILLFGLAACGGSGPMPGGGGNARASGQSKLMDGTFAGANKCTAKGHERPFIIEWDATDMSSFEAKAASDVVVVKYEGCELTILDRCSADSLKGANGAYGAVEWTSGSVEKIDIKNEGELYAKLPLGAATLGGRVQGGEAFHMEYYVSGSRKATRPDLYRADIEKIPGCKGATHFVYAYNLGAFALGSANELKAEAGGTVWGIGAGGSHKSVSNAEKKGGVLTACSGETAKESASCKVPIRLSLREISDEENPDAVASRAPETPTAANLAGKVDQKLKMNDQAMARYQAALERFNARDGKGCLKELDAHDRADSNASQLSTNPKSSIAMVRSQCVMLAGQCDNGKQQLRRAYSASASTLGPEQIDNMVDFMAGQYCQGASMSPRDQLIAASSQLSKGTQTKLTVQACNDAWATVKRLAPTVQPRDEDDQVLAMAKMMHLQNGYAAMCLGRAGDCAAGLRAQEQEELALYNGNASLVNAENTRRTFEGRVPRCKSK